MRIKYHGIKGHAGDYDLGRAALVQGPNDVGKSSLVAAIHFALTGKMAAMRMGKGDTQDPGRLLKAMADNGWAEATLDGSTVRRTLEPTTKKARILTVCDGLDGKDGEAAAARLQGDLLFADFRRLVAAGDKERADVLTTYLLQPDDKEKLAWVMGQAMCHTLAALQSPKRGKKAVPRHAGRLDPDAAQELRAQLLALADANDCGATVRQALSDMAGATGDGPEDLVAGLKKMANAADAARKDATKVAAEAAKSMADTECAAGVPDLEAQVNAMRSVVSDGQTVQKRRTDWEAETQRLSDKIENLTAQATTKRTTALAVDDARKAVAAADALATQAQRGKPEVPQTADIGALRARGRPLDSNLAAARKGAARVQEDEASAERARAALERLQAADPGDTPGDMQPLRIGRDKLAEATATLKARGVDLRERVESAEAGACPLTLGECPDDLGKWVTQKRKKLTAMAKTILSNVAQIETLESEITDLQAKREAHHKRRAQWVREITQAEASHRLAVQNLRISTEARDGIPALEAALAPIDREIQLLEQARTDHEQQAGAWMERKEQTDQALADARQKLAEAEQAATRLAELEADVADATKRLDAMTADEPPQIQVDATELEALEARLSAAHAAQARLDVIGRLDIDGLTHDATIRKAMAAGAAEGLTGCVQEATTPICTKITQALNRMGVEGSFYVDLENRTFGIIEGGVEVDVEVLGGGKAVLFAAAMLSALPPRGGPRVLTLEGAELHPDWMRRLLDGLDWEAFDAVVVATCNPPATVPDGWTVVDMGGAG